MSDDTAKELAGYLAHARAVCAALPNDEEAERLVGLAMQRRSETHVRRKLTRKVTP